MTNIHPTAIIDPKAKIGVNVSIGPYCCIGEEIELENDVKLHSHVVLAGRTKIGARTEIFPFASIGHRPQDLKYKGETSYTKIGTDNMIREYVTIQPGTEGGGFVTKVGNHCLLMASAHIAHDCVVGDHVILANNATLGGHVIIEDYAIIGGLSAIHQFVRIGEHAMIGGMSGVEQDVIPYGVVVGERARLSGLNLIGLKRRGFSSSDISNLRHVYRHVFDNQSPEESPKTLKERIAGIQDDLLDNPKVQKLVDFIKEESHRHICLPKSSNGD